MFTSTVRLEGHALFNVERMQAAVRIARVATPPAKKLPRAPRSVSSRRRRSRRHPRSRKAAKETEAADCCDGEARDVLDGRGGRRRTQADRERPEGHPQTSTCRARPRTHSHLKKRVVQRWVLARCDQHRLGANAALWDVHPAFCAHEKGRPEGRPLPTPCLSGVAYLLAPRESTLSSASAALPLLAAGRCSLFRRGSLSKLAFVSNCRGLLAAGVRSALGDGGGTENLASVPLHSNCLRERAAPAPAGMDRPTATAPTTRIAPIRFRILLLP